MLVDIFMNLELELPISFICLGSKEIIFFFKERWHKTQMVKMFWPVLAMKNSMSRNVTLPQALSEIMSKRNPSVGIPQIENQQMFQAQ